MPRRGERPGDCADDVRLERWLVAGTSRSGKTSLLRALGMGRGGVIGLPVEGMLVVYLYKLFLFRRRRRAEILSGYLERPRRIDGRGATARPLDSFATPLSRLVEELPQEAQHQVSLIAYAMDRLAQERGALGWAACDVNAEMLYPQLRRRIPGLKLAVLVRDPFECLAANLYWRTYPARAERAGAHLRRELLRWGLSVRTALALRDRYPEAVTILRFDELMAGHGASAAAFEASFGRQAAAYRETFTDGRALFSRNGHDGFLTPAGTYERLLQERELVLIADCTGPLLGELGMPGAAAVAAEGRRHTSDRLYRLFFRAACGAVALAPEPVKLLSELLLDPVPFMRRKALVLRQLVGDNMIWRGVTRRGQGRTA